MSSRIVTLTLNPCIDLNLEVEDFSFTQPMRALRERKRPGGKGMNVSYVLCLCGTPTTAIVPLGGPAGQEFVSLTRDKIDFPLHVVEWQTNTRTNIVITSQADGRHLKVNQQGEHVTPAELANVEEALSNLVHAGDCLVLAGSLPPGTPADIYAAWAREFRARGCFVALDADNQALREGIEGRPHFIKPNRQELERLLDRELGSETEIMEAGNSLLEHSCDICLISDGENPAYLFSASCCLKGYPPPAHGSAVGAGDACMAGMMKALAEANAAPYFSFSKEQLREAFHLALACGSAAASTPDTEYFTLDILSEFREKVVVEEL